MSKLWVDKEKKTHMIAGGLPAQPCFEVPLVHETVCTEVLDSDSPLQKLNLILFKALRLLTVWWDMVAEAQRPQVCILFTVASLGAGPCFPFHLKNMVQVHLLLCFWTDLRTPVQDWWKSEK